MEEGEIMKEEVGNVVAERRKKEVRRWNYEGGSGQHSCGEKEEGRKYIIPQTFITRR